ncbi:unnamed protein product [marine sediment metagenome]|uniref:Uncharacterized protein n=1 Tax=marine sediment metagenome TaxID=412755 RepID=X0THK6_9ZZZZ
MTELTEKPDDMTDFQWNVYQDRRDEYWHRTYSIGSRWNGSPWEITGSHVKRACNTLVRKGYFIIDPAGHYHLSEGLGGS